jgi:acyl-CoA thioesterase FadM
MQEAAFGASAAVRFSAARYASLGLHWFAYETDIEYYRPLRYGDTVTLKTWVQDFRRVRSLRQYVFYRADEEIAHATTDWVLVDVNTLRPTTISQEIIDAYARGDDVEVGPSRSPLVPVPRPSQGIFVQQRRVECRAIDPAGHVS